MLPALYHAGHPWINGQVGPLVTAYEIRNKGPRELEESKTCVLSDLEIQRVFQVLVQKHSEDHLWNLSLLTMIF